MSKIKDVISKYDTFEKVFNEYKKFLDDDHKMAALKAISELKGVPLTFV